jgi:hypothetical protein
MTLKYTGSSRALSGDFCTLQWEEQECAVKGLLCFDCIETPSELGRTRLKITGRRPEPQETTAKMASQRNQCGGLLTCLR